MKKTFFLVGTLGLLLAAEAKYDPLKGVPPKTVDEALQCGYTRLGLWRTECEALYRAAAPTNFAAAVAAAHLKLMTCPEKDFDAAAEAFKRVLVDPAYPPAAQLDYLADVYRAGKSVGQLPIEFDPRPLMRAIRDRNARNADIVTHYYSSMLKLMWSAYDDSPGFAYCTFDATYSHEAKLELIDAALKDPLVKNKGSFVDSRNDILFAMERWAELEAGFEQRVKTATNASDKVNALLSYATYATRRQRRFFAGPWPVMLRKAIALDKQAMEIMNESKCRYWRSAWVRDPVENGLECAALLKDPKEYRFFVDARYGKTPDEKTQKNVGYLCAMGDLALWAKDWDGVIRYYGAVPEKNRDGVSVETRYRYLVQAHLIRREWEPALAYAREFAKKARGDWKEYWRTAAASIEARKTAAK